METWILITIIGFCAYAIVYLSGIRYLNEIREKMPELLDHQFLNGYEAIRVTLMIPLLQLWILGAVYNDWRIMKARIKWKQANKRLRDLADELRKQGLDNDANILDQVLDLVGTD